MQNKLPEIRIVLLNTFHPGNIGAAARAMKTMGIKELVLVNPKCFPDTEATSRAAGAVELLEQAKVVSSLEQAIEDCTQVFGTSARQTHSFSRPQKSAEEAALWVKQNPAEKVAIVFGGERDGMSSHELNLCQQILFIPGDSDYSVLNVSAAAQIVCYELFKSMGEDRDMVTSETEADTTSEPPKLVSQRELNNFYSHLEELLIERNYIRPEQQSDTLKKLRTLINRAEPSAKEVNLLRGMIKALSRNGTQ
ncbi:RNA methyltransferase [Aliikangiella coralliicola]|uniref:RNA methyltransferase n=1 Tax=Aliikangiella coralliicola TaxID=2592383 RepID=UPI00143D16CB|nr:RNA methyltransferase [Aliikangiella coralliicola]